MTEDFLTSVLSAGGIAALVAATVTYILKTSFDTHLKARIEKQLEMLRAENEADREYMREVVKKQTELYPGLIEVVYKSRNVAREMIKRLPEYSAHERSNLGDLALVVTDMLYATRVFLRRDAFKQVHDFKTHLQQFVFDYDHVTGKEVRQELIDSLNDEYNQIDRLCEIVVTQIQDVLRVEPKDR